MAANEGLSYDASAADYEDASSFCDCLTEEVARRYRNADTGDWQDRMIFEGAYANELLPIAQGCTP